MKTNNSRYKKQSNGIKVFMVILFMITYLTADMGFRLLTTFHGESKGDAFSEVCGLGDINQDGYDDFAVGAWEGSNGGNYVKIYFITFSREMLPSDWHDDKT